jgi:pimeloyl-ACP methyl ester carboxylesterase
MVQEKVAEFTRVCSYDRPGFGWSEPVPGPLSSDQVAANLHGLLESAGVPGPYILVGHSDGGVYVRSFANQYPTEVRGMVLVDASHESQNLRFPAKFKEYSERQNLTTKLCQYLSPFGAFRLSKLWNLMLPESIVSSETGEALIATLYRTQYCKAAYDELTAASEMLSQPEGPVSLGDLPLIVLSAGATYDEMPEVAVMAIGADVIAQMDQVSQGLQQELVSLSTQGVQVIAEESGHFIQWDQPYLVIDAIRTVVEQVRAESKEILLKKP